MKLGINLADLKNTQQLIETTRKQDPTIEAITVFNLTGNNEVDGIFKTDKAIESPELKRKVVESLQSSKK